MLEIFAVMLLADNNAKKASERGRDPRLFRNITYVIWFVCEIFGFFIVAAAAGGLLGAYFAALLSAAAGGLASYLIVLNCTPGNYRQMHLSQPEGAVPLDLPCILTVSRISAAGSLSVRSVCLNGQPIGNLKNGENVQVTLNLSQNVITAKDSFGNELKPLYFSVPSGGSAWICFNSRRFLPENSGGITVISDAVISLMKQDYNARQQPHAGSCGGNGNDAQKHSIPAPSQPAEVKAPSEDISDASPMRAVWLLAALNIFMLLTSISFADNSADVGFSMDSYGAVPFSAAVGVCIYLFQQYSRKYKLLASAGLIVSSFVKAFSYRIMLTEIFRDNHYNMPDYGSLISNAFTERFAEALLISLTAAAASLFICSVYKASIGRKTLAAAAVSSVLYAVCSIFSIRMMLFGVYAYDADLYTPMIIQAAASGAVTAAFAAAAYLLGSFRNQKLVIRGSAKVWCIFCALVSFICFVSSLTSRMYFSAGLIILHAAGTAGYILMLMQKRIGFPAVLCSALLSTAVIGRVLAFFIMSYPPDGLVLISMANPLICWILIRNEWNEADSPGLQNAPDSFPEHGQNQNPDVQYSDVQFSQYQPLQYPRVQQLYQRNQYAQTEQSSVLDAFYALCAVINLLTGGFLFALAAYTFIIDSWSSEAFFMGTVLGGFVLALSILVFRHFFSRTFRAHKAVLVIQALAAAGMTVLFMSAMLYIF